MSFVVRLVLRIAGSIGVLIAAFAVTIALLFAIGLCIFGVPALITFAKDSPEIGVPILTAIVVFCLYCAFFRKEKTVPQKDVLRGPVVIRTEQHTIFVRPQQGSGEAEPDPESRQGSPSTAAPESRFPWNR